MAGLEDLYREIILDHYRSPRNRGELEAPPAYRAEGFNPLCGDELIVTFVLDDEGVIGEVGFAGQGCSISQASASMMTSAVKGKTLDEARSVMRSFKAMMSIHEAELDGEAGNEADADSDPQAMLGDLEALRGVVKFPVRIKCATLGWNTLDQAIDEAQSAS
jgi:nitrogen fixation NifU-like protein